MILASSVHHHKTEEVPAHDAAILQEKAGAKIGPVSQEDDVLRTVGVQDIGHVEDSSTLLASMRDRSVAKEILRLSRLATDSS